VELKEWTMIMLAVFVGTLLANGMIVLVLELAAR